MFIILILFLFSSCSGSISDNLERFTEAMNTNMFVKHSLTAAEKETLKQALTIDTLPLLEGGQINSQTRSIMVLDGSKVDVTLCFAQNLQEDSFNMLEVIPNEVRESLSIIFNNEAKGQAVKAYLAGPLEGTAKVTINKCAKSMKDVINHCFANLTFPDDESGRKIEEVVNGLNKELNESIDEKFEALTKGDLLAISVLSSSINNVIAKVGAQAIALGEYPKNEFEVFAFDWNNLFDNNSEKYVLALIDSVAQELAFLNAILPYCGSFINFDIKAIADSLLGG